MKTVVIDASVAAKLLFEEDGTDEAEALCARPRQRLLAPDLLPIELASVAWKRFRRAQIDAPAAAAIVDRALDLPISLIPSTDVLREAAELALSTDRTVYDCLYIAVALAHGGILYTADARLVNALAAGPLAKVVKPLVAPK